MLVTLLVNPGKPDWGSNEKFNEKERHKRSANPVIKENIYERYEVNKDTRQIITTSSNLKYITTSMLFSKICVRIYIYIYIYIYNSFYNDRYMQFVSNIF